MDVYKKWWFLLIIILLIVFFYPKNTGFHGSNIMGPSVEHPYYNRECTCIGIKYSEKAMPDFGEYIKCLGLPINCRCFQSWIENGSSQTKDISCEE